MKYNSTITFAKQIFHSDSYFIFTRYFTRSSEFHWKKHSPKQVLFLNTSNSYSPDRENVTKWQKGDCEERATRTCDRSEILSCNCPWSGRCTLYFFLLTAPLFCHRKRGTVSQLTGTVRLLCVMAQVRVYFKVKQKRPLRERSFSFGASNSYSPDRGNVTQWQKGDCEVRAARTCGRSETLSHYFAFARSALCFFLFSDCFLVHRTRTPAKLLTAACSANWAIEAYSVFLLCSVLEPVVRCHSAEIR